MPNAGPNQKYKMILVHGNRLLGGQGISHTTCASICIDQILTEFGEYPCATPQARILAPPFGHRGQFQMPLRIARAPQHTARSLDAI
jgi:hypothetical protein